jgi:hypothetical protein
MSWVEHIEGNLPADDLRRAFVMGAKWWEYFKTGATMWGSDRNLAEEKAEETFPGGKVPEDANTVIKQQDKTITQLFAIRNILISYSSVEFPPELIDKIMAEIENEIKDSPISWAFK